MRRTDVGRYAVSVAGSESVRASFRHCFHPHRRYIWKEPPATRCIRRYWHSAGSTVLPQRWLRD